MFGSDWHDFFNELSKLIARAWLDGEYRDRFIADPKAHLLAERLTVPDGVEVQVDPFSYRWKIEPSFDYTSIIFTIGLPPKPPLELGEERLSLIQTEGQQATMRADFCWPPRGWCSVLPDEEIQ